MIPGPVNQVRPRVDDRLAPPVRVARAQVRLRRRLATILELDVDELDRPVRLLRYRGVPELVVRPGEVLLVDTPKGHRAAVVPNVVGEDVVLQGFLSHHVVNQGDVPLLVQLLVRVRQANDPVPNYFVQQRDVDRVRHPKNLGGDLEVPDRDRVLGHEPFDLPAQVLDAHLLVLAEWASPIQFLLVTLAQERVVGPVVAAPVLVLLRLRAPYARNPKLTTIGAQHCRSIAGSHPQPLREPCARHGQQAEQVKHQRQVYCHLLFPQTRKNNHPILYTPRRFSVFSCHHNRFSFNIFFLSDCELDCELSSPFLFNLILYNYANFLFFLLI